jgi:hypothetical protein
LLLGRAALALLFLLHLLLISCAGALGPSETTLTVYRAANDGDVERLGSFYSEYLAAVVRGPIEDLACVRVRCDEAGMYRCNAGERFPEDNPVSRSLPLVREDGAWKVGAEYLSTGG